MEPLSETPLVAADVVRGVSRLFFRHDLMALGEVPLANGRRADIMALDPRGQVVIVEIKCSRADLRGDMKWPDYLDYCDRFYWAVPHGFDTASFEEPWFRPECCGLIVADRYDAAIVREAVIRPMPPARRKAEVLGFGRRAAGRLLAGLDPEAIRLD